MDGLQRLKQFEPVLYLPLSLARQREKVYLDVTLTSSEEVLDLRDQVATLTARIDELQHQLKRAEYLYRCETVINTRLMDYCRSESLPVPKSLFDRPYTYEG